MKPLRLFLGILLCSCLSGFSAKFTFDLSKGPVSFHYTTIGEYNPVEIIVIGEGGTISTWISSRYYNAQTLLKVLELLTFTQHGAVTWTDLIVESLKGTMAFTVETPQGSMAVNLEGEGNDLNLKFNVAAGSADISQETVTTRILANFDAGVLTIQDNSPGPAPLGVAAQRYKIPPEEINKMLSQFPAHKIDRAFDIAGDYFPFRKKTAIAGGAGMAAPNGCISVEELSPQELFRLSLLGLKYQGYLKDSTLYMRVFHPQTGACIKDMRVIITVVEEGHVAGSGNPNVVLWDVLPYVDLSGCYLYGFDTTNWRPGRYEVYIDVGRFLNFILPLVITDSGRMMVRR